MLFIENSLIPVIGHSPCRPRRPALTADHVPKTIGLLLMRSVGARASPFGIRAGTLANFYLHGKGELRINRYRAIRLAR